MASFCERCNRSFGRPADLERHDREQHDPSTKKICPVSGCEKETPRMERQRAHMVEKHPDFDGEQSLSRRA